MSWKQERPKWGIVLGSGLGSFIERIKISETVEYGEIPGLPTSGVAGHAGRFVFGKLAGKSIVAAQGRVHLYEDRTAADVTANIRWMVERGVRHLILTNAAGTANLDFRPGQWMMITDHLNLTGTSPLVGPQFIDMSEIYAPRLRERFEAAADVLGVTLHQGVYAGLRGPQYETPAEIRMLQKMGADAVGMSTVLEAIQAHALGVEVSGFSCLTNWAAGISRRPLSHKEVLEIGQTAAGELVNVLEAALREA